MTKLTDKTYFAALIGIMAGFVIYMAITVYEKEHKPRFTATETVIEVESVEVSEQLIQETDCVEIIEYDMSTGTKTTIGCISKEST